MSEFQRMITSAQTTLIHVMDLKKNDSVLVITDEITKNEGEAFYNAAVEYGCKAKMYSLPEKKRPLIDVPKQMKKLAEGKTIIINAFKGLADETPFRIKYNGRLFLHRIRDKDIYLTYLYALITTHTFFLIESDWS